MWWLGIILGNDRSSMWTIGSIENDPYNLFIYLFNIIEILIVKINYFLKIYNLLYTPFLR